MTSEDEEDPFVGDAEEMDVDRVADRAVDRDSSERRIVEVNAADDETVELVAGAGDERVSTELTGDELREYREAFDVDDVQEFEGRRVVVSTERDGDDPVIEGPVSSR